MLKLKNMKLAQKFTILGIVLLLVVALPTIFYFMNVNAELEEYTRTINSLYEFNAIAANNLVDALNTRVTDLQQSLYWMFGLVLCALIGIILLAVVFVRSIVVPMRETVEVANAVASGDFTSNIDVESTNETGQLFQALKKITGSLQEEKHQVADLKAEQSSVSKARMMVMFKPDGTIVSANEEFLNAVGYTLGEVQGKHHSIFVDPNDKQDPEYQSLWDRLSNCEFFVGQYKRIGKGGKEVWIQSNYNPVMDANGKSYRVVLYGTDITAMKLHNADSVGQLEAVNKAYAVVEFTMDGMIIAANNNFLNTLGYTLEEIKGKSHDMFVDPTYRQSRECKMFWDKLVRGEYDTDQYKRIGMGGKEVWIQASYNPILDMNNNPFKVVVYATDITQQINASQMLDKAVEQTLAVVSVAKDGDLTQRIPLKAKTGAIETLCTGINDLMENCSTSLDEVVCVLSALARGNLTEKIANEYNGVFGQMKDDTNTTVDKLTEIVGNIRTGTTSINTVLKGIAAGNSDLSQRTDEQASSLKVTASSMEELTSTVKQNAENAKQANLFVIGASDIAMKSSSVVGQVVTTMSEINDSSKQIVDIISLIDGIAFQTNILALNAAVEAARAGEQGRGFAVVATEVRALAQRSAAAAKEIKKLIDDSVSKVNVGTELVDQAGKTMDEIVMSVKHVTDIMAEISAASQAQSSGIEQVNQAVSQIDEATQQNAALVEEAAAASESMIEQSNILMRTVSVFQLEQGAVHMSSASSPTEERRGSNRAINVARLPNVAVQSTLAKEPVAPKSAKSGTDNE